MIGSWIVLAAPAWAGTLDVALGDKTGTLITPRTHEVSLGFKAIAEGGGEATWSNTDSNSIAVACTDKGAPPEDDMVEQLMLKVGADRWALAPGSAVKFACPAGKSATVTDLHGQTVGTFKGGVVMTATKVRARAAR